MISKNKQKLIRALESKKGREKQQLFVIEGNKMSTEALKSSLKIATLICTEEFHAQHHQLCTEVEEKIIISQGELREVSLLQNAREALVIAHKPQISEELPNPANNLILALDNVQDPGNLGTIIRVADWYGIRNIVASKGTVDQFNPKLYRLPWAHFSV